MPETICLSFMHIEASQQLKFKVGLGLLFRTSNYRRRNSQESLITDHQGQIKFTAKKKKELLLDVSSNFISSVILIHY